MLRDKIKVKQDLEAVSETGNNRNSPQSLLLPCYCCGKLL